MNQDLPRRNTLSDAPRWVHIVVWGAFAAITLACIVLYVQYREANPWPRWLGESAANRWPTGEETHFSERIFPASIFRTPANTFSNLGYVFVGFYILAYAFWDHRRTTTQRDPYAVRQPQLMVYFGVACCFLGFGSGFMHASLTSIGHWYDLLGMYGSLVAVIALQWARWLPAIPLGAWRLPTWPVFAPAAMGATYYCAANDGRFGVLAIMGTLIGMIIAGFAIDLLRLRVSMQHRWYILSLSTFVIAYAIWNLAEANRFAGPDDWWQGHALWHVLTAFALGFLAILYRSEVPRERGESVRTTPDEASVTSGASA